MPMIEIRRLQPEDTEAYRALWFYGITEHSECFRISPDDDSPMGIPTRFKPDSFTLGAFSGRNLIGIVSFERDSRVKARHKGLIFRMFVHPDAAGRGAGNALLQHLISSAKDLGDLRYLYLTVLASNTRAIRLYSSLRFREFAREPGGVLIDGDYVDELQMAHQLLGD
jgi:ribosomal protein S18 acetylase RimI-like enzyme